METELQKVETSPLSLIEMAIDKGLEIDKLERLFELQERHEKNKAAKAFKAAMVEFQMNKPELIKSKKVDHGYGKAKYSFLPLPKLQKAIDHVLSKFGLSYRWEIENKDNGLRVICIVSHVDGHEERTSMDGPRDESGKKLPIHQIGSTRSYLERYTVESAFGLSSDEDTDGIPQDKKPLINPDNDLFPQMEKAIKDGKTTIQGIEQNYSLTSTAKTLLQEAIDPNELDLLFDLVADKVPSKDIQNIKRIIDQKEVVNYSKILFTLTKLKDVK